MEETSTRSVSVSAGFFEALGVELLAGRDFVAGAAADSGGVILNEAAARRLMAQVPGRYATPGALAGEEVLANDEPVPVVGVVRDFHIASLHEAVQPTGFYFASTGSTLLVRIRPGSTDEALAAIGRVWPRLFPEAPLDYQFADAAFDAAYRTEERLGRLFMLFAGLAIVVACLGLFGLAAYAAEQRRKEIGVRKVLGASVGSLVGLLSREFARLVLAAIVVGAPVAYYGTSRWLEGFTYRAPLGPGVFIVAGVLALTVALATVSFQALRAASADPVKALRSE
jgi:putative ABC transport system permease protein